MKRRLHRSVGAGDRRDRRNAEQPARGSWFLESRGRDQTHAARIMESGWRWHRVCERVCAACETMALAMEQLKAFLGCTLYLIALINPMSKVFILSVMAKDLPPQELRSLVLRSSVVALAILLVFAIVGSPLLTAVFHVEIYSFQLVGGLSCS